MPETLIESKAHECELNVAAMVALRTRTDRFARRRGVCKEPRFVGCVFVVHERLAKRPNQQS